MPSTLKYKKLGTFGGVFTPDVLTILGVIMYLRLGWVVGNAGFLGALLIIVLAKSITVCTALSMASITTNIKIGAGGAYSIISKSLGLEAGGSIGIPFYVSQTLSAALYIVGFAEGWLFLFPAHNPLLVGIVVWVVLLIISSISANFAIKTQYVIIVIIGLSIISFLLTPTPLINNPALIGSFKDASFWQVFAIFFPAVTGIMAGANLSGDLKDPRKSIPIGTLSAIGVTFIIYAGLAYILSAHISPEELRANEMVMVDNALFGKLIILGILAATFSSALGSMIGSPRILQALAAEKTIPFSKFFQKKNKRNEPFNANLITGLLILIALLLGDLNALAALITMFFLITYGMLNLVVFIQQSMKIISFRPTFKIPRFVPFIGAIGSIAIMLLINPIFSIVALLIIISIYIWLTKQGLTTKKGDLRGGMFVVLAEKATRIAAKFPRTHIAWKPDILLPIEEPKIWAASLLFIKSIVYPSGSIYAFSIKSSEIEETKEALKNLIAPLEESKILVNSAVLEDYDFIHGAKLVMQTLAGGTLRPNMLFLTLGHDKNKDIIIKELITEAKKNELGIVILRQHQRTAFGLQKDINIWLRDKSPNWHLAVLLGLQLHLNWAGKINLLTVAENEERKIFLYKFLNRLGDLTRLPAMTEFHVMTGDFKEVLTKAPRADINIFGLSENIPYDFIREAPELANSSCLFVRDSGKESAVA